MNILILVRDYKSGIINEKNGMPAKSGAEIHVERHALAFKEQGHHVTVMAKKRLLKTPIKEMIDGIQLIRLPSGFRSWMCIYYFLKNIKNLDAVYVFGQPSFNLTAIMMSYLCKIPAVFVSTMTGEAFETIKSDKYFGELKPFRKYHNWVLKLCSDYIAISREIGKEFIANGFNKEKVHVMPQGVDISKFKTISAIEKRAYREKLGLPVDKKIVLFCSRLDVRKGVDILLATWKSIHEKSPDAHLLVVGGGLAEHVQQLKTLMQNDQSITYAGEVEEPLIYFQLSDVFAFPSRREGCPNVLMEAMACGCAPVTSKIGGCEDLIIDGQNGILFTSEDRQEYEEALVDLLNDGDKIKRLGKNAAQEAINRLDVKKVAKELVGIFNVSKFNIK